MKARTLRLTGVATMAVSAVALGVALLGMTDRLRSHYESDPRDFWQSNSIHDDEFTFDGAPIEVRTVGVGDDRRVDVRWKGDEASLPVTGEEDERFPELLRHQQWLRVMEMAFVPSGSTREAAIEQGVAQRRVVVVSRERPVAEAGERLSRRDRTNRSLFRFIVLPEGERLREEQAIFETLDQRSWQWAAAVSLVAAKPDMVDDGFEQLGWTWGLAQVSVLLLVIGAMIFGASFVRTDWAHQPASHDAD